MPDRALYDVAGIRPEKPSKYNPIATYSWIGGLQTQRSPFVAVDTRYNKAMLGGKPDALLSGSNCEINNSLTLQRRPGLDAYGPSIPAPDFYFDWQQAQTANFISIVDPGYVTYPQGNLQLLVDTPTNGTSAPGSVYNYSPTVAGILFNKSVLSGQTSFDTVASTVYMGDGVDLYKQPGANLLSYSNTFTNSIWSTLGTTSVTGGQTPDPTGGSNATSVVFSAHGSSATAYLLQHVSNVTLAGGIKSTSLNYTPVAGNTFTFSVWMKGSTNGLTVFLGINDSTGNVMVNTQQTLTTSWALYQVTGTAAGGSTGVTVLINDPSSQVATYYLYGAQLEVGGPATPTVITTTKPLGIYLWGITAPTKAPTFTSSKPSGAQSASWAPSTAYSQNTYTLTSVAASVAITPVTINGIQYSTAAVYTGTIGVSAHSLIGRYFSVAGFVNAGNNSTAPGFVCIDNNGSTTVTLANLGAVVETHAATATLLDSIVDSNGNLEIAYTPGTSGTTQPTWNAVVGGSTADGLQNIVTQATSTFSTSATASMAYPANVTANNTKLIFVASRAPGSLSLVDSSGDTPTLLTSQTTRDFKIYLYYVLAATAGATTISLTGGGASGTWLGIAEIVHQTATDGSNSLGSFNSSSTSFLTGSVTTTNAIDVVLSFALFSNSTGSGYEVGSIPFAFQGMESYTGTFSANGGSSAAYFNLGVAFEILTATGTANPQWSIVNVATGSSLLQGITGCFKSSVGSLVWYNVGQNTLTGLSPKVGYTWYYAFVNTYTGHRSNVSPLSSSTGIQTGVTFNLSGLGACILQSGTGAGVANTNPLVAGTGDPQVDAIELYRNQDGDGFWYQVPPSLLTNVTTIVGADGKTYIANPGTTTSQGVWTLTDQVLDSQLNTQIYAPVGLLNSVPPQGLTDLEFFDGRMWGSVGATLYYATAADDASLININTNGVSAESWEPTNFIPLNSPIVRIIATGAGLIIFTTSDVWGVSGTNLATYTTTRLLTGIGLGTYNGICIDGSTIMMYTRDRQSLIFNVNMGCSEIGFLIGDAIEADINPLFCYLARHVKGSQDNAFYFGDGQTGWFRMNPNNYGASMQGEQTPIWSPFATIASAGACGAINSVEVQPGIKLLLVGAAYINATTGAYTTGTFPILNRDITVFKDNGTSYSWNAVMGSLLLALPGKLAEIESLTTEMRASVSTQTSVGVLINEISGSFEDLTTAGNNPSNDPTQIPASISVISNRFYLSPGTVPPIGRHMQVKLTSSAAGDSAGTKDEVLAVTVRGALIEEQQ